MNIVLVGQQSHIKTRTIVRVQQFQIPDNVPVQFMYLDKNEEIYEDIVLDSRKVEYWMRSLSIVRIRKEHCQM